MFNSIVDTITEKTTDQYKIIEDKYITLKRYLKLFFNNNRFMTKEDAELIIQALDKEPLEFVEEKEVK